MMMLMGTLHIDQTLVKNFSRVCTCDPFTIFSHHYQKYSVRLLSLIYFKGLRKLKLGLLNEILPAKAGRKYSENFCKDVLINETLLQRSYLTEWLFGAIILNSLYQLPFYCDGFQTIFKLCGFQVSRSIATQHAKFRSKILSELINRKYFSSFYMFLFLSKNSFGISHLGNERNFALQSLDLLQTF